MALAIPSLNRLLKYGKTLNVLQDEQLKTENTELHSEQKPKMLSYARLFNILLDVYAYSTKLYVPKSWFTYFYVSSLAATSLCVYLMQLIEQHSSSVDPLINKIVWLASFIGFYKGTSAKYILYLMMAFQGARRLFECIFVEKQNPFARIHIFHYIAGIGFYFFQNLAIININDTDESMISYKTFIGIGLFLAASVDQFWNHHHLSTLVKYTLPTHGLFKLCSSPHYLDEILIYLSLMLIKYDTNLLFSWLWVVANLGASSNESWQWYKNKFGERAPRWRVIPYVF